MAQLDYLSATALKRDTGLPYTAARASYWADVGATTPLTVYSDAGLTSALSNPVVADGTTGVFPAIYLQAKRYWRTVTTSIADGTVSLPQFNSGPIDGFVTLVESATAPSPTYKLMYWYDTTTGKLKRRDSTNASWLDLGGIDSLLNAASVTDQLTGTSTTLASTPDSVAALWQRGSDIASAATLSLPATGGGVYNITGTTNVSAISSAQGGRQLWLKFAAALTLTHNGTSFILPGAANITTVAGDMACFINEAAADASGSNWRCFSYQRSSGSPINVTDQVASQATLEADSSTSTIVTPGRAKFSPIAVKAEANWNQSGTAAYRRSYGFSSFTDNGTGDATLTFTSTWGTADYSFGTCANQIVLGSHSATAPNLRNTDASAMTTTTIRVHMGNAATGGLTDQTVATIMCSGDLA